MSLLVNVVLAVTFVAGFIYWYITKDYNYWKKKNVAGPKPVLFFGNIKELTLRKTSVTEFYLKVYNKYSKEKVVGLYRHWNPCLLVRDVDILKRILIKDFDNFVDRGIAFGNDSLGSNLFHTDGDTWRVLRSRFSPIFTSGKLKAMMPLMLEQGDRFVQYLETAAPINTELELFTLIQKFTMASIASCAFGIDLNMNDLDVKGNIYQKINNLIVTISYATDLDLMFPGILKKISMSLFPTEVTKYFEGLVSVVMKERRGVPSGRKDFMDLMLELRNAKTIQGTRKSDEDKQRTLEITDSVMSAQAFVFYAGGYETSATTVSFLLRMLALHQDIQEKVVEEINEMLEKNNGEITFDGLKGLQYLGQVFSEILRMHPLVDPMQRLCEKNYKVPGTDLVIEAGTVILYSAKGLHYDEKYFQNPHEFNPDRFSPENAKNIHPCAYLPFGAGPRNCIGERFAHVQSRLVIVKLLTNYKVLPTPNTEKMVYDPTRLIPGSKDGILAKMVPRK